MLYLGSALDAHLGDGSLATDTARVIGTDLEAVKTALLPCSENGYLQVAAVTSDTVEIVADGVSGARFGEPDGWSDNPGAEYLPRRVHTGSGRILVLAGAANDTTAFTNVVARVETVAEAESFLAGQSFGEYLVLNAVTGTALRSHPNDPLPRDGQIRL